MSPQASAVLAINAGSSSIKFAVFEGEERLLGGGIERVGQENAALVLTGERDARAVSAANHEQAADTLLEALTARRGLDRLRAVGHRIVHGGVHRLDHQRVTPALLAELRAARPLDLDHLPGAVALIERTQARLPGVPQIACFDTAFHHGMPRAAQLLPIPRTYDAQGIRRLGFHGISYAFLLEELGRVAGARAARGRVVLAHLGAGSSLAAVRDGRPMDTTMGFTPTSGVAMATRPGDLDPGVLVHLMQLEGWDATALDQMVSRRCGLIGISETSADMRELLAARASDRRAAEAVELFCYQVRKAIGAFAAALGGLDTVVLSGGIGEHAAPVRAEVLKDLAFLGVDLDPQRNERDEAVISTDASRVTVRVIRTDEERMIARYVVRIVDSMGGSESGPRISA
jgi:acetate kinase